MKKVTHLDISGINALEKGDNLQILLVELNNFRQCENLLAIHISDLGINNDQRKGEEIFEIFNIPN